MTLTVYTIQTARFGTLEIGEEETLRIVEPMPGFDDVDTVALIPVDEAGIFVWVQSVTTTDVAFLAVNPFVFHPEYDIEITGDTADLLGTEPGDDVVVYTLVSIRGSDATTNLAAPFVVNARSRRAVQVIVDGDQPLRAPLDFGSSPREAGVVTP